MPVCITILTSFTKYLVDGSGEISETPRPCKADELAEFVLLDGTPSTCANIGLYNLYPDAIDLVVSALFEPSI